MRFREIKGGIRVPISNEELDLVKKIEKSGKANKTDLSEREQEIARKLVSRGVLTRKKVEEEISYYVNELDDVWRD